MLLQVWWHLRGSCRWKTTTCSFNIFVSVEHLFLFRFQNSTVQLFPYLFCLFLQPRIWCRQTLNSTKNNHLCWKCQMSMTGMSVPHYLIMIRLFCFWLIGKLNWSMSVITLTTHTVGAHAVSNPWSSLLALSNATSSSNSVIKQQEGRWCSQGF